MTKDVFVFILLLIAGGVVFFILYSEQDLDDDVIINPENTLEKEALGVDAENIEEITEYEYTPNIQESPTEGFVDCLADAGIVIYGSSTCPYCEDLVDSLGGYDAASSIYVECSEERQRCNAQRQTNYVPEIQINGEVFKSNGSVEDLAQETGCVL